MKISGSFKGKQMLLLAIPISLIIVFSYSCTKQVQVQSKVNRPPSEVRHPEWSKKATIYEVNIRQYTRQGTFKAFQEHLPRLKQLGVDILWLMPIHPVGEKNRKGTLGSYYAIRDYKGINPEFGSMNEFKELVSTAHELGFKIILDWVANHTAWDHNWIAEHPEWYVKDSTGAMVSPYDWSDVAHLSYENKELWVAMIDALKFWVAEADVDGYRCDVAGMVPTEFWEQARQSLDSIKPVFMLAEAEQPDHHFRAFDMSYAWELHHLFNKIAKAKSQANEIDSYFVKMDSTFPLDAYRMSFTSNHDENSWNGTEKERLGEATKLFAVLTYTLPGMPLIYSGQETGLNKRLAFFEKDTILWDYESPMMGFYTKLNTLKHDNEALWNGLSGSGYTIVNNSVEDKVLSFLREKNQNKVFVIANLTDSESTVDFPGNNYAGTYQDYFTGSEIRLRKNTRMLLVPWEYKVFISI